MKQTELNIAFRNMYYSHPANSIENLNERIRKSMGWNKNQLKERLLGRVNVKKSEVELICIKCNISIAEYFPGIETAETVEEVR